MRRATPVGTYIIPSASLADPGDHPHGIAVPVYWYAPDMAVIVTGPDDDGPGYRITHRADGRALPGSFRSVRVARRIAAAICRRWPAFCGSHPEMFLRNVGAGMQEWYCDALKMDDLGLPESEICRRLRHSHQAWKASGSRKV